MYVKMRTGKFAGEIKDLRSDVALEFIRRGEAERAFQDPPPVVASGSAERADAGGCAPPVAVPAETGHAKRHRNRR